MHASCTGAQVTDPGIYFFIIKNCYLLICGVACCHDSGTLRDVRAVKVILV